MNTVTKRYRYTIKITTWNDTKQNDETQTWTIWEENTSMAARSCMLNLDMRQAELVEVSRNTDNGLMVIVYHNCYIDANMNMSYEITSHPRP